MIYPILAKYQSTSLPKELRFEATINDIDDSMKPFVQLKTDFYEDIASEIVIAESEQRTLVDIQSAQTNNDELKAQIHKQLSFKYPSSSD